VPDRAACLPLHDELQRDLLPLFVELAELLYLHLLHLLRRERRPRLAAAAALETGS
jgi:hypothetical protein